MSNATSSANPLHRISSTSLWTCMVLVLFKRWSISCQRGGRRVKFLILLYLPHLRETKQADLRYNAQIHSIIVALSLHVVVLIKDLNGNHVIQKCLNKLAPEDNQVRCTAFASRTAILNITIPIVHLQRCRRQLCGSRHSSSRVLCTATMHRSCVGPSTHPACQRDNLQRSHPRTRPIRKLR